MFITGNLGCHSVKDQSENFERTPKVTEVSAVSRTTMAECERVLVTLTVGANPITDKASNRAEAPIWATRSGREVVFQ